MLDFDAKPLIFSNLGIENFYFFIPTATCGGCFYSMKKKLESRGIFFPSIPNNAETAFQLDNLEIQLKITCIQAPLGTQIQSIKNLLLPHQAHFIAPQLMTLIEADQLQSPEDIHKLLQTQDAGLNNEFKAPNLKRSRA